MTGSTFDRYSNHPFNPEIGMHCWGFVRFVYLDRTGIELLQFPYLSPALNGYQIDNICSTLPRSQPKDLSIFVGASDEGDRAVGIILEEDGILYGAIMDNARSRVLSFEVLDRALKPLCYSIESLERRAI